MLYLYRFRCTICNSFNVLNVTHRHVRINGFRVIIADIQRAGCHDTIPRRDREPGTSRCHRELRVSDVEHAPREKEFIYQLNRLNVSITRARSKTIVFMSRTLLEPPIQALDISHVADGIAYMQGLMHRIRDEGETLEMDPGGTRVTVYRR